VELLKQYQEKQYISLSVMVNTQDKLLVLIINI